MPAPRDAFGSRFGVLATMIGVAVGLGNVWRFPYMAGQFGGAAFVGFYLVAVAVVGIPALSAEWTLGRHTRRGPVGAFRVAGLPLGDTVGWFLFAVVTAATAYYAAVIGWVAYHAVAAGAALAGSSVDASAILPPERGFSPRSSLLQAAATAAVIAACAGILLRGLKAGIEAASKLITPALFVVLVALIVRALTLPGATAGVRWYLLKLEPGNLTPPVMLAALGQAVFSLALGGTFMVVYGSYLHDRANIRTGATLTAAGDTAAGLLAGLAIIPAVFALDLPPGAGPGLLFETLPRAFHQMPAGGLFGLLFFTGLAAVGCLSAVAAFEVLVAGLTDNTPLNRRTAAWTMAAVVFLLSLPPTVNLRVFRPWDLTFGSGMQTVGALIAVLTVGWCLTRAEAIRSLGHVWLYRWIRYVIPWAIASVGVWWVLTEIVGR